MSVEVTTTGGTIVSASTGSGTSVSLTSSSTSVSVTSPATNSVAITSKGPKGDTGATGPIGPDLDESLYLPLSAGLGSPLTGDLIVDTNVGIGTSTPTEKLEVIGDILLSGDTMSDAYKPNAAGEPIKLKNFGGDEVVTVLDSGNVGIGTDSPDYELHVVDTGNAEIVAERTSGAKVIIQAQAARGKIGTLSNHQLRLGTNSNDNVTIDTTGDVGIGTTSPTEKLDVSGNIKASGNINLEDNGKAIFGDGNDLEIYHSGSNSYIKDVGTGSLSLDSNGTQINLGGGGENFAVFRKNAEVELYFNGVEKFATTSTGASVAGELDMNSNKITEVLAGSNNLDAVNYQQLNDAILGVLTYKGIWNASTNSPALVSGVGTLGGYYIVSVAGTTDLDGITDWAVGDWAVFSDLPTDAWQKIDNTSVLGGAGTGGKISVWTGSGVSRTLGDSIITESGSNIGIGTASPIADLQIGDGTTAVNHRVYYSDGTYTEILGYGIKMSRGTSYIRPTTDNVGTLYIGSPSNTWAELLFHATTTIFNTEANGESMRINSLGNVGIGTTSPETLLHLDSSVDAASGLTLGYVNSADRSLRVFFVNATGGNSIYRDADSLRFATGASAGSSSGATKMVLTDTGNVGIGTTSPDHKLRVSGDARLGNLHIKEADFGNGGTGKTIWADNAGAGQLGLNSSTEIALYTNAVQRVVVDNSGNVGIGTTSPGAKLEIKKASSGVTSVNSQADALFLQNSSSTGITIATPDANKSSIFFSSASRQIGARINWSYSDLLMTLGTATANASLALKSGNESEAIRILSNGNVGIGTTSPAARLYVQGAVDGVTPALVVGDVTASLTYKKFIVGRNANEGLYISNDDSSSIIASFQDENAASYGNLIFQADDAGSKDGYIDLKGSSGGSRMRLLADGNVGIGTTSPGGALDVVGTYLSTLFRVSNTDADATTKYGSFMGRHYTNSEENITGMLLTSSSSATGGTVSIGGGITSANAVNNIKFYTATNNTTLQGTERMRITSTGNVGIGTTAPDVKLEILKSGTNEFPTLGTSSGNLFLTDAGLWGMFMGVDASTGTGWIQQMRNDAATAYNISLQPEGGNVGIGTTTPASKLDVSGGDVEVQDIASGIIMKSPDGTRYRVTVANGGTLSVAAV